MKIEVNNVEESVTKIVKASGNSGRVYLPPAWIGREVEIILPKDENKDSMITEIIKTLHSDSFKAHYVVEDGKGKIKTTAQREYAEYTFVDSGLIPKPAKYGNLSNIINGIHVEYKNDEVKK